MPAILQGLSRWTARLLVLALVAAAPVATAQEAAAKIDGAPPAPALPAGADYAGKTVYIRKGVTLDRSLTQERRALQARENVFIQDAIETRPDGAGRIVMKDRSMLALAADSRIELTDYHFEEGDPARDAMVTRAVKGSLMALTGLVDKRNPDNVQIDTRMTTIGVRGTAVRVDLLANGHEEVTFEFGKGFVRNRAGTVEVAERQSVRITSPDKLPEFFQRPPNPRDPAELARRLARMSAAEAQALARQLALQLSDADLVLLLGLLEQLPDLDIEWLMNVLEGLIEGNPQLSASLVYTAVRLADERAPLILRAATAAGMSVEAALREVLLGMENLSQLAAELELVLIEAVQLGITRDQALGLIEQLRQQGLCT
jgi:hypothetical protein